LWYKRYIALTLIIVFMCIPRLCDAASVLLKEGAQGDAVWELQLSLFQLGFLQMAPTGMFEARTLKAVRQFQQDSALVVDGAVGEQTWHKLRQVLSARSHCTYEVRSGDTLWSLARHYGISVEMLARANGLRDADKIRPGQRLVVPIPASEASPPQTSSATPETAAKARAARERLVPQALSWSEVQRIFPHNTVARIIDVKTGKSFRVRRYYGHLHADVEPLTAEDTAVMKSVYGQWSWLRRAIVVEVAGRRIAASMNGFPHGKGSITSNDFGGHFCIHFADSRVHRTGRVDPDHQAAIQAAVRAFSSATVTTTE
jgi:hypothetical protein